MILVVWRQDGNNLKIVLLTLLSRWLVVVAIIKLESEQQLWLLSGRCGN